MNQGPSDPQQHRRRRNLPIPDTEDIWLSGNGYPVGNSSRAPDTPCTSRKRHPRLPTPKILPLALSVSRYSHHPLHPSVAPFKHSIKGSSISSRPASPSDHFLTTLTARPSGEASSMTPPHTTPSFPSSRCLSMMVKECLVQAPAVRGLEQPLRRVQAHTVPGASLART